MASCGTSCGITRERERQKDAARALVRRVFPAGWADEPAWSPEATPFAEGEADDLAGSLAEALPCRTRVVRGVGADWVYVLASLMPSSWLDLREAGGAAPEKATEAGLRVGLSTLGRYATLQEVRLSGTWEPGGWWVEEARLAGIEDRRLQLFVKAAQGILRRDKVVALDAAFLAEPVDDPTGRGAVTTGVAPTLWTVLFDLDPAVTRVGTFLPVEAMFDGTALRVIAPSDTPSAR